MSSFRDFQSLVKPNWCPGCGDFSVQAGIQRALANLGLSPENVVIISGIGCSGRISGYIYAYGFHATHGRALPLAQGLKLSRPDLHVIVCAGDGDGFAIGLGHTIHAMRRDINLTYIVMDNQVYGLTKGQASPRSEQGFKTKSSPEGVKEEPLSSLFLSLSAGASFVAQTTSVHIKQLTDLIEQGIKHPGFSFLNVLSPCVTFNQVNSYDWIKKNVKMVEEISDFDTENRMKSLTYVEEYKGLLAGLIYQKKEKRTEEISHQTASIPISRQTFHDLLRDFK